jgi:hypothetical protein
VELKVVELQVVELKVVEFKLVTNTKAHDRHTTKIFR